MRIWECELKKSNEMAVLNRIQVVLKNIDSVEITSVVKVGTEVTTEVNTSKKES